MPLFLGWIAIVLPFHKMHLACLLFLVPLFFTTLVLFNTIQESLWKQPSRIEVRSAYVLPSTDPALQAGSTGYVCFGLVFFYVIMSCLNNC